MYLDKPDEPETYIMLYISLNGFYLRVSTGLKIAAKGCHLTKGRQLIKIKNNFLLCEEYNTEIDRIVSFIRSYVIENNNTGQLTRQELLNTIASFKKPFAVQRNLNTLHGVYNKFVDDRRSGVEKKAGTYESFSPRIIQKYETAYKWLRKFAGDKGVELTIRYFSSLEFFNEFTLFLFRQNLHRNTVHDIIKTLKTFAKWAVKNNYVKEIDTSDWKIVEDEVLLFALDEDELSKIENLDLSEHPLLSKVRNLFLIQCYTGLRFSDLMELTIDSFDMSNKILRVRTIKTDSVVNIPITPKLQSVLAKDGFQLEFCANYTYNVKLKEIGQLAEVNAMIEFAEYKDGKKTITLKPKYELLSSHCGRRTFITNALRKGISERLIMKITGHKSLRSFEKYIKLTETEAQNAFMDAFK
jgi:integrase